MTDLFSKKSPRPEGLMSKMLRESNDLKPKSGVLQESKDLQKKSNRPDGLIKKKNT